jgi:hypothetical protein
MEVEAIGAKSRTKPKWELALEARSKSWCAAIKAFMIAHEYRNAYISLGLLFAGLYWYVRSFMILQEPWSIVWQSKVTVNMMLVLFLWGYFVDKKYKGSSFLKYYGIMFGGLFIIGLVFRFGFDVKSIFG